MNPDPEALVIRDWQFNAKNEPLLQFLLDCHHVLTSVLLLGGGHPHNTLSCEAGTLWELFSAF